MLHEALGRPPSLGAGKMQDIAHPLKRLLQPIKLSVSGVARDEKKPGAWPGLCVVAASAAQWPEAPEAPRPVSERTCCAGNTARSLAAWALLSSTENSHTPTKPMVMENSAGEA